MEQSGFITDWALPDRGFHLLSFEFDREVTVTTGAECGEVTVAPLEAGQGTSPLQSARLERGEAMNGKDVLISLELLILNDLLLAKAIDKEIYDKAVQRIECSEREKQQTADAA